MISLLRSLGKTSMDLSYKPKKCIFLGTQNTVSQKKNKEGLADLSPSIVLYPH